MIHLLVDSRLLSLSQETCILLVDFFGCRRFRLNGGKPKGIDICIHLSEVWGRMKFDISPNRLKVRNLVLEFLCLLISRQTAGPPAKH